MKYHDLLHLFPYLTKTPAEIAQSGILAAFSPPTLLALQRGNLITEDTYLAEMRRRVKRAERTLASMVHFPEEAAP